MAVADLDRALYEERSLVKHLSMRRTLFVFPRETLASPRRARATAWRTPSAAVSSRTSTRPASTPTASAGSPRRASEVLEALADGREASSTELRDEIPLLEGAIEYGNGKSWGGTVSVGPRVLTVLSAAGRIVRASNDGAWTARGRAGHRWRHG